MAQSFVLTNTPGAPGVDNTSEVVLETDSAGNPTKVIGFGKPCELTKDDKAKLEELGFEFGKSEISVEEAAALPQVGSDTVSAGPKLSN